MQSLPFLYRRAGRSRRGVALILVLAVLALMSILLVSFVSMASRDRSATQGYAKSLQADQMALGGLDVIVSQIQSEITDGNLSTTNGLSGNYIYIPKFPTNAIPQRTTAQQLSIATLITTSGSSLYSTNGVGITNYASGSSTLNSSLNGRVISTARWNKPQLMTSTASFPAPQWVLVNRAGPTRVTAYGSALSDSSTGNANYVVGRYAYTVYDTSGLLDANVAGYPTSSASSAAGKGLLPWADLTQLPGISTSDVDALAKWRNPYSYANNYPTFVTNAAATNGFTRVASGDNLFLSRQELIKYANQSGNTDWLNALPYLTTFSRELNGPTWGPTTGSSTIPYAANQYTAGSFNPRIPNPRVLTTGAGWTRNNGLVTVAGEPLVKYRFPLDKLALLEKFTGTGQGTLSNQDVSDILRYFGLDLASDANGPSFRHWNYPTASGKYVHNAGTSGANGVMSLDDVASQNREPDFFELLQAGMLSGSLGVPGKNTTTGYANPGRYDKYPLLSGASSSFVDPDDSATLQTLRIGANIIDQWDADSFPTTISYTPSGSTKSISVYGIEDLPYPVAAYFNIYAPTTGTTGSPTPYTTPLPPFNFYLYFALWNPHQTPATINTANYPSGFRFYPFYNSTENLGQLTCCDSFVAGFNSSRTVSNPGTGESWFYNGTATTANGSQGNHTYIPMLSSATNAAGVTIGVPFAYSPTSTGNNYREPILAVPSGGVGTVGAVGAPAASVPHPWDTNACLVLPPLAGFPNAGKAANNDGHAGFPSALTGAGSVNGAWQCQYDVRMVMPVQYMDSAGIYHTYGTFVGIDDQTGAYSNGTYCEGYTGYGVSPPSTTASLSCPPLIKADPRTFRFGVGGGASGANPDVNVPYANSSGMVAGTTLPPISQAPFAASTPYRMDLWAANDSTVGVNYPDIDGVTRWGDARNTYKLGTPTSPLYSSTATTSMANRPAMLNRPFQSVGELGYVYRDMAWKTLDLFSANSADSGLLDLFTLSDTPIVAGRVNPNTPYSQVVAAMVTGATQSTVNTTTVSSANALTIGNALTNTTTATPFLNRADLVNNFMANTAVTGASAIKTEEEAAVRSIAESSNTRTWNLMIDVIAQAGEYPKTAGTLDNFVVEGERRYWLHLAIDRYTGQVVDKQLEVVNE